MAITVNIYYTGNRGAARKFAEEMTVSGVVDAIRAEAGNLRYAYFFPMEDPETVLLIDSWRDQQALDTHHASPMMAQIARLREQYDLHMRVERYLSDGNPYADSAILAHPELPAVQHLGCADSPLGGGRAGFRRYPVP